MSLLQYSRWVKTRVLARTMTDMRLSMGIADWLELADMKVRSLGNVGDMTGMGNVSVKLDI